MIKRVLSNEEINSIINEYQENNIGVDSLATKYKVGKLKIRSILSSNNIAIKNKGAQVTIGNSTEIEKSKIKIYEASDRTKEMVAICKKTGKPYDDINNLSGALTRHILEFFDNVSIPKNTYQRKKYEIITGKKWFEEYFDIIEIDKKETIKCDICDWETYDLNNSSGSLTKHILDNHNLSEFEYMNKFPNSSKFWENKVSRVDKLNNYDEFVTCLECGEKFLGLSNSHLKTIHNMDFSQYREKWGDSAEIFSNKTIDKLSELTIEMNKNMVNVFTTKPQLEIKEFLENELGLHVLFNDRKTIGIELDILVPSHNIAIEYNGLYWHSETLGKHEKYHIGKTELCLKNGISLIHIFEDEWKYKKEIVLKRLAHIFKISTNKKYARKCEIREINSKIKDEYLNKNHIQGTDKSSIRLGAYYADVLVGVMTFSKFRKSVGLKNEDVNSYEMVRFANDNVVGLASKFLKYFRNKYNPIKIISYADIRWTPNSDKSLYSVLGFKLIDKTKPNYWYTKKFKIREHRFNFRKDILVSKGCDSSKTEKQIMLELGYHRIWDCGSFKYELIF
jgi:hypothetical protein